MKYFLYVVRVFVSKYIIANSEIETRTKNTLWIGVSPVGKKSGIPWLFVFMEIASVHTFDLFGYISCLLQWGKKDVTLQVL